MGRTKCAQKSFKFSLLSGIDFHLCVQCKFDISNQFTCFYCQDLGNIICEESPNTFMCWSERQAVCFLCYGILFHILRFHKHDISKYCFLYCFVFIKARVRLIFFYENTRLIMVFPQGYDALQERQPTIVFAGDPSLSDGPFIGH